MESYQALLRNTGGVILLVGPTGSGKSTTMCVMLRDLAREEVNIVTPRGPCGILHPRRQPVPDQ
ncbi:MAG: ATPase, T2SS/T4P/T4SS family [Oscillospiraceae bacterium]